MAKALPIPGIGEDDPFGLVAARVVQTRAQELFDHSHAVLETEDIEPLHAMRVATRRLRASLEVFEACFPRKRHRAALREVKSLADALGERRDRDVTLELLQRVAAAVPVTDRPGVLSLADAVREEQAAANRELAKAIEPERLDELAERLSELVAAAERSAGVAPTVEPDPPARPSMPVVEADPPGSREARGVAAANGGGPS